MSNMAGRNSSLHQRSKIPVLYQELMQDYIYQSLLSQECKSCKFDPKSSSLYEERNYADTDKKSNMMVLSIPQPSLPKSPINNSISKWNEMLANQTMISLLMSQKAFWIKYPRNMDKQAHERSIVELFIGATMNKMRRRIPNFVYTLGGIRCIDSKSNQSDTRQFCSLENGKVVHIVQERVEGVTLDKWLAASPDPHEFMKIILQIAFALAKAQEKKGFVHKALYPSNIVLRPSNIQDVSYHLGTHTYKIRPGGKVPTIIDYSSARATNKGFAICYLDNPTLFHPGIDLCKLISSSLAIINQSIYNKVSWLNDYFGNFFDVSAGSYDSLYQKYEGFNLPSDNPLASLSARNFIQWVQTRQGHLFNSIVQVEERLLKPMGENEKSIYKTESLSSFESADFSVQTLPVNYNLPLTSQYDGINKVDYLQILDMISPQYRKIKDYICIARLKANDNSIPRDKLKGITSSLFEIKEILRHNIAIIRNLPLYKLYRLTEIVESMQKITGSSEILLSERELIIQSTADIFPLSESFINNKLSGHLTTFAQTSRALLHPTYYEPDTLEQAHRLKNLGFFHGDIQTNDVEYLLAMKNSNKWPKLPDEIDKQIVANVTLDIMKQNIKDVKIRSLMDFGGGDGKLASIMATKFNIPKANTWSADVENWMGNKTSHIHNVSYLDLKEEQPINLPSKTIDLVLAHQVLHHIKNVKHALFELRRICNGFLVLWERDCSSDLQRMLLDFIHSIKFTKGIKDNDRDIITNKIAKYLNDYEAWYRSFDNWKELLVGVGFKYISSQKINDTAFVALFS